VRKEFEETKEMKNLSVGTLGTLYETRVVQNGSKLLIFIGLTKALGGDNFTIADQKKGDNARRNFSPV